MGGGGGGGRKGAHGECFRCPPAGAGSAVGRAGGHGPHPRSATESPAPGAAAGALPSAQGSRCSGRALMAGAAAQGCDRPWGAHPGPLPTQLHWGCQRRGLLRLTQLHPDAYLSWLTPRIPERASKRTDAAQHAGRASYPSFRVTWQGAPDSECKTRRWSPACFGRKQQRGSAAAVSTRDERAECR